MTVTGRTSTSRLLIGVNVKTMFEAVDFYFMLLKRERLIWSLQFLMCLFLYINKNLQNVTQCAWSWEIGPSGDVSGRQVITVRRRRSERWRSDVKWKWAVLCPAMCSKYTWLNLNVNGLKNGFYSVEFFGEANRHAKLQRSSIVCTESSRSIMLECQSELLVERSYSKLFALAWC